ncbi:A Disintegrin And Metalloproteinase With Thrombospondin Motifs 16 [Manis pentadactyla]|nr:A Disintegrin And Metalloproteinase With Thrombospondin Motifs 16 [Manis pentadactyla]
MRSARCLHGELSTNHQQPQPLPASQGQFVLRNASDGRHGDRGSGMIFPGNVCIFGGTLRDHFKSSVGLLLSWAAFQPEANWNRDRLFLQMQPPRLWPF